MKSLRIPLDQIFKMCCQSVPDGIHNKQISEFLALCELAWEKIKKAPVS